MGLALWQIYAEMPHAMQEIVRHWTSVMAQGMEQFSDPARRPSLIGRHGNEILASEADYDDYCYYVAGTVGHLATELVIRQYQFPDDVAHAACTRRSVRAQSAKDQHRQGLCRGLGSAASAICPTPG